VVIKIHIVVYWIMTMCSLVCSYQHVGETYCFMQKVMF